MVQIQGDLLFTSVTAMLFQLLAWARSEVGLSRLPVTEEIAGSNPVGPAKLFYTQNLPFLEDFCCSERKCLSLLYL